MLLDYPPNMVLKRLLLINYEYPPLGGGAGNATANLARSLTALGHEILVLTSAFRDLPRNESTDGFQIHRVPVVRPRADRATPFQMLTFMISASFASLRVAREFKADAVIAFFGIPCGPIAYFLKCVYRVPYLVSLRGGDVPGFQPYDLKRYHQLTKPMIVFLWRHASAVVANSTGLQQLAQQSAPELTIHTIPNGVDTLRFSPAAANQTHDGNAIVRLLFVGRLTHQKGLDVLFRALASLPPHTAWSLSVIGDGDDRTKLENLARELELDGSIRFEGWSDRNELPRRYQAADAFVLASRDEGMSNAVLEAMASGLPVVTTRIAGSEELIRDGHSGILVPPDDVAALGQALGKLIADPAWRAELGREARSRMEQEYKWDRVAERYSALITDD